MFSLLNSILSIYKYSVSIRKTSCLLIRTSFQKRLFYGYLGITESCTSQKDNAVDIFENVLTQYEPMISACIRKLNIYKNHEFYRQAGRIALWRAWVKYDATKGDFAPFAYRTIYGAMLDELKKEKRVEEAVNPVEDEKLSILIDHALISSFENENLGFALEKLTSTERELISWIFVEGISLQQAATRAAITIPGIKKRRERMLEKLRESMK